MKVLTHEEMRAADRSAIKSGIPGLVLMENAAYGVLRAMERRFGNLSAERIVIFCGKGNNGGDGLALARLLSIHHQPESLLVFLAYPAEELSPDAASQLLMLEALQIPYTMQLPQDLAATTIAVDALLGTGFSGEAREPICGLIEILNNLPLASRVAVDVPSALSVQADLTVTFAAFKPEHVLPPHCDEMGEIVVAPIGIPTRLLESAKLNLIAAADLNQLAKPRARDTHKGTYGHVAMLGGAPGKNGALNLACEAAIQAGAGWVTAISPDKSFVPRLPDVMSAAWPDTVEALKNYRVVGLGPGLGTSEAAFALVRQAYSSHPGLLVLDADALNLLSPLNVRNESGYARVLTPHPGEMRRLLGREIQDRCQDASVLSAETNTCIVLKGHRSVIAFPDGQIWVNPTGSPSLAKAGSGDVLTGMIAAFMGQFATDVAVLGAVYLHGRCGELAHERTSLASNLCTHLAEAFDELG